MSEAICNAIINWLNILEHQLNEKYKELEKHIWQYYFCKKIYDLYDYNRFPKKVLYPYFNDVQNKWYEKLNLLEYLFSIMDHNGRPYLFSVQYLNKEFTRLNYAYSIINGKVEEITSKEEIESIEEALKTNDNGVKTHLNSALEYLSASNKTPDYRNSIKESISAVETLCRKLTGANDLGKALSQLEKNGITIQPMLKKGIEYLYHYTNDKTTGIRHALLEDGYTPTSEDAIFMLVTCSAFINFLKKKNGN